MFSFRNGSACIIMHQHGIIMRPACVSMSNRTVMHLLSAAVLFMSAGTA
jgi:hypothetical protein